MDELERQIQLNKGENPTKKAKHEILEMLQEIKSIQKKVEKITESKESIDLFLNKCLTASAPPKLFRTIRDLSEKSEAIPALLKGAKEAEEKRVERAEKRREKSLITTGHIQSTTVGGITINVNVQNGGATISEVPTEKPKSTKPKQKPKYKKAAIPSAVKTHVWNQYVGSARGEAACLCCNRNMMDKRSFHAGHVIPESKGGKTTVENLRPICADCNLSMRDTDMREYAMTHYERKV